MMDGIKRIGVVDVLCIATRYFGGILLGAGGLVRAYSRTACDAVRAAKIVRMLPCIQFQLSMPYPYWGSVQLLLERFGSIQEVSYTDVVSCTVWVQEDNTEAFQKALTEKTEARVRAVPVRNDWFPFSDEEAT